MTADQNQSIAKLQTLYESGALDKETYETAVSAILGITFNAETDGGTIVQGTGHMVATGGGVNVAGSVGRDLVMGNVYHGPKTADPKEALRIYRQVLLHSSGSLPLRGVDIGASDAGGGKRPLGLANVYVDLDTTSKTAFISGSTSRKSPPEPVDLEYEAISVLQKVIENHRLVLTGDPGGGKSTFVNHLAHCLAAHQLSLGGEWLQQLNGWPKENETLLPLVVILRDFADALPAPLLGAASPNDLWAFIVNQLEKQNLGFAAEPVRELLENGFVLLLLDGLDEVTATAARLFVRDAVVAFLARYPHNRCLVTCRILSYQPPDGDDDPDLRLPKDFVVAELAPFDEAKIDQFIDAWYAELVQVGTVRAQEEAGLAQRLKTSVRRPDLWRLAPNPLLLTVMALVHTHQGRLPDARALLYENTINLLLWRWEEVKAGGQKDAPPLRQLLLDAGRTEMDLRRLLWQLAFAAHQQTPDEGGDEALADISETQLTRGLEGLKRGDWNWVHQMVTTMKLRAGLLVERTPGRFTFPHRTFQEYLAGAYLSVQSDFSQEATRLAGEGSLWREVILLAVGRLVHLTGDRDKPYALVNRLCPVKETDSDTAWNNVWLAGDVLLEMGLAQVAEDDGWGTELVERVRQRLAWLLTLGRLTPRERMAAGDTLGWLGDPRPGVCTLEPELVPVAAGKFLMGEEELHEIEIAQPYAIGRYPVTNAQYQLFMEDGGYTEKWQQCWTEEGWQWKGNRSGPRDNDGYTLPNQPRVGVSWYEAVAFVRWLAEKTGKPYRLPTEAEWERAARHTDGRTYPWGEAWHDGMANTKEAGLGRTTAVGIFLEDTAVCGAQDLGGNVAEWCQTRRRNEQGKDYPLPYKQDDGRENLEGGNNIYREIRGGVWGGIGKEAWSRCGACYGFYPLNGGDVDLGFRVVVSPFFDSEP